jgi:hypothetical protein
VNVIPASEFKKPWEPRSETDKFLEASKNILAASEKDQEAQRLRIFGGRHLKAGGALVGAQGLTLQTDFDFQSTELRWLVKNVIPDTGVGVIYGDSGTFKSFVALDLMAAIATGRERWFGYRVKCAPCIYVPFEGRGGIPKRVEAWRLAAVLRSVSPDLAAPVFPINFGVNTGIIFITDPLNLRSKEDRDKLVEVVMANGLEGGVLCIDTLAQAGHGIDENSSEGMGEMIAIFQELQRSLGGVILVVHHTGKDASRGMRGHSSLRGAQDFAIECSKPDGAGKYDAQLRVDKVKDEEAGAVIPFSMQRVTLGVDDDGDRITSLVVAQPEVSLTPCEVRLPNDAQLNASTDDFVWTWIRKEVELGSFPSSRSLAAQLSEMKRECAAIGKRDHIRDAIERLLATNRLSREKQNGNPWLLAIDTQMPPYPEGAPSAP